MISGFGKNYSYNGFNQLVAITNTSTGKIVARFSYDDSGNRFKKIEYNIDAAKNNLTTYYISDNFIQTRNTNGTILNETYIYADGTLVAMKDNSGNKLYYHPDHLGSTTLVTNQSGDVVEENFYYPYGESLEGTEDSRHLYTGKEKDKDSTDLYYYGARYYDSNTKYFIQPDSIIPDVYNTTPQ